MVCMCKEAVLGPSEALIMHVAEGSNENHE
jgi:hypothetical protein